MKVKIQSFVDGKLEAEVDNYEDFIGFCPRPMKLEVTLSTITEVNELLDFLNEIKIALLQD
jgi:hypothetical protein